MEVLEVCRKQMGAGGWWEGGGSRECFEQCEQTVEVLPCLSSSCETRTSVRWSSCRAFCKKGNDGAYQDLAQ